MKKEDVKKMKESFIDIIKICDYICTECPLGTYSVECDFEVYLKGLNEGLE